MQLRLSCVGPRSRPWLLSSLPVHQPRYMPPVQSSISRDQQPEASWEALTLAKRGLRLAIVEEDYRLAATLRDRVGDLTGALPPRKRLLASMLDNLQQPEVEVQAGALRVIGELADCDALPQLSLHLATPQLQSAVEAAMWHIFMHSDNLRVQMLMREACTMLNRPGDWEDAVKMFTAVVEEEPSFAEGYNKRATVLFLLQRYRESIQDCKLVLDLNPYHFAAASGMGMCYSRLGDYESAIQAFERALAIHPGMTELRQTCEQLRTMRGEE